MQYTKENGLLEFVCVLMVDSEDSTVIVPATSSGAPLWIFIFSRRLLINSTKYKSVYPF